VSSGVEGLVPKPPESGGVLVKEVIALHRKQRAAGIVVGDKLFTHNFMLSWPRPDWNVVVEADLPLKLRGGLLVAARRNAAVGYVPVSVEPRLPLYMPVEGIESWWFWDEQWYDVDLCPSCLRVVTVIKEGYYYLGPPDRCFACGELIVTKRTEEEYRRWDGDRYVKDTRTQPHCETAIRVAAKWHSTATFWRPSTWGTGHWQVRNFDAIRQKPIPPAEECTPSN
jgi:hypothetical protein